ncbi:molybdenum cofactor biosynthesis protein MoaE [Chitiniphilus purpureus]|uniref:Molybdopterin synthase catalytic subunit n=1 Tax=Chitiniphilus purpureus TaxID=2981137 RepID=A0ABY6DNR6_9NEIS|nr:molybdenum cofactor biosynthesis protein MoaE [Chitiniphilus sp. CD1]UXY15858.1 molybdenum cofactor biosynthesis protein MoaE [Chitiniphilus sp. CD1]
MATAPDALQTAIRIAVQHADFDLGAELAALDDPARACGAVASFVGRVRRDTGGDVPLSALTLEHYPGMTEKVLRELAAGAGERFSLQAVTVVHRIGLLRPGEQIVLVLAAAPHRKAALAAVDFLMDHLKSVAPFWKCEQYGAQRHWVQARADDEAALARWQTSTP